MEEQRIYKDKARIYDLIYKSKDYKKESEVIINILGEKRKDILEVCCGTGNYLKEFEKKYNVTGFDINSGVLDIAKEKTLNSRLIEADMKDFNLNLKFDAVLCLFSSIGYCQNKEELDKTIQNFANHLNGNGVIIVDTWVFKGDFINENLSVQVEETEFEKLVRVTRSTVESDTCCMDMHYTYAKKGYPIEYFDEFHVMGLFSKEDYLKSFEKAGLKAKFMEDLAFNKGRHLFIAKKS